MKQKNIFNLFSINIPFPKQFLKLLQDNGKELDYDEINKLDNPISFSQVKKNDKEQRHLTIYGLDKLTNFCNSFEKEEQLKISKFILKRITEEENSLIDNLITLGELNYNDYYHTEMNINKKVNNKYLSKKVLYFDIDDLMGSVYTHSFAWAVLGRDKYKEYKQCEYNKKRNIPIPSSDCQIDEDDKELMQLFDEVDEKYRNIIKGDNETVGLFFGQNLSDILINFILSFISSEIKKIKNYGADFNFHRCIDDYTLIFYTEDESKIRRITSQILKIFKEFKMNLSFFIEENEKINKKRWKKIDKFETTMLIPENEKNIMALRSFQQEENFSHSFGNDITLEEIFLMEDMDDNKEYYIKDFFNKEIIEAINTKKYSFQKEKIKRFQRELTKNLFDKEMYRYLKYSSYVFAYSILNESEYDRTIKFIESFAENELDYELFIICSSIKINLENNFNNISKVKVDEYIKRIESLSNPLIDKIKIKESSNL